MDDRAAPTHRLSLAGAFDLARDACLGAGASSAAAESLANAIVRAEVHGRSIVGFRHLLDYLDGFKRGRINGTAEPSLNFPAPGIIQVDAGGGIAQLGYDRAFADFRDRAKSLGIAIFTQRNSFTTGELGDYVRRLAEEGIVGLAMCNGPALMAPPGAKQVVYGTNPLAFAAPLDDGSAVVIDQASSSTAFVNVRAAAENKTPLPDGWAVDRNGVPTNDPSEALAGRLLTFGGNKGANIALLVELMAAGLAGANWSVDAPRFSQGNQSPGAGLTVIAIAAARLGEHFPELAGGHLNRLAEFGVYIPGRQKSRLSDTAQRDGLLLRRELIDALRAYSDRRKGEAGT